MAIAASEDTYAAAVESRTIDNPDREAAVMKHIPIRGYDTDRLVVVAAPMPGLEPTDIVVEVRTDTLIIRSESRGHYQDGPALWMDEWRAGDSYRELRLPHHVDGPLANATYGNGVLVVALPKAAATGTHEPATIQLTPLFDPTRGERVGHFGHAILPTTTESHLTRHLSRPVV